MRTTSKAWVALLLLLALPGCKPGASSATGLAAIHKRGELRIAMTGMYPPFNFFDAKNRLVGFDVDVAGEVAKRLGLPPRLVTLKWSGIIAGLDAGRYDLIIGSMAITAKREKAVDFSTPYYVSGAQVFAAPGSKVERQDGLAGAVVGVNLGTTYEAALRKHHEVKSIRTYSGIPEILVDMRAGRLDAFVTDRLVGLWAAKERGVPIAPVGDPLYLEHMGIAMQRHQPKLLAAVNAALAAVRKDGTYLRLSKKWFGRDISAPLHAAEPAKKAK